jgi:hypothetical protein
MMPFNSRTSLLIFCLDDLSIADCGLLKSPATTVLGSTCAFKSFSVCWWNWVHWHWVHIGWKLLFPFDVLPLLLVWSVFFILFNQCKLEVYLIWYKYYYSCLFSGAIGLVNLLPAFHPKPVKGLGWKAGIQVAKRCLLMGELSPLTFSVNIDRYVVILII